MKLILPLLTLASVLCAQAPRGSVAGRVLDPTGAAVPGAAINLVGRDVHSTRSTRTGADGRFRFAELPAGDFFLEVNTGSLDQAEPVRVRVETAEVTRDVTLSVARISTRLVVTASAGPQTSVETGKAVDLVDGEEMERRAEFSLTEALRLVPGLRVQQLGGPGTFTRVLTRGLRATDTGLLIDGLRFRDAGAVQGDATAFLGDLLPAGERIEVLRGSGSSLYGTNATGGVVNILTRAGNAPRFEVGAEGGGLGLARGQVRGSGGAREGRLLFSGSGQHLNVSSGAEGIERVRNWSGQAWSQWRVTPASSLSARFLGATSMVGVTVNPQPAPAANLPASGFVPAVALQGGALAAAAAGRPYSWGNATFLPNLYDPDSRRVADYSATAFVWNQQVSPRAGYRVSYQLMDSDRDNRNGPGGPGFQTRFNNSTSFNGRIDTLQARTDLALSRRHALSAGYEYERERYDNTSTDENPDPAQRLNARTAARQRSHAAFFHDQLRLFSERLQVSLSGRWQGFRLDRPLFEGGAPHYRGAALASPPDAWTGDAALSYFVARTSTKWRAHAGNSYRVPALYERFGAYYFMGSFGALGDPRLRPERSLGLDAGVDQFLLKNRLRLSGTVFYTRLQEVIGYGNTPNDPFGRFGGYLNTGGGLARGVEVSAEARPDRATLLRASYTHTNADERTSSLTGGALAAIRVFPNTFTLVATRSLGRRWEATADFWSADQYIGGTFFVGSGIRPYLFDGPHRLDATVAYTRPLGEHRQMRFFVRAENLLGQTYFEEGFHTPRRWVSVGLKLSF